ncbi:MAG: NAD(P)-dependent oxidoreductase [Alphaproteobacteria bacterium]
MKIVFFESNPKTETFMKTNLSKKWKTTFIESAYLLKKQAKGLETTDILSSHAGSVLNIKTLAPFKNLKAVVTRTTGIDHIDIDYCKKQKIKILSVPSYGTTTVAEFTFTLMLALMRKLDDSEEMMEHALISQPSLCGSDLAKKTLGIIGLGKIGLHVAEIAHGFGMKIFGYDPSNIKIKSYINRASLQDIYKQADIISLHCPGNCHTENLLNKKAFQEMKNSAIIINTARGQIIETEAFYEAIQTKQIAGAALDVADKERFLFTLPTLNEIKMLPKKDLKIAFLNQKLLQMKNVLMTPHMAFNTKEANLRILKTTLKNLKTL